MKECMGLIELGWAAQRWRHDTMNNEAFVPLSRTAGPVCGEYCSVAQFRQFAELQCRPSFQCSSPSCPPLLRPAGVP